jgi:nucleotide-binding universal stress UspA family protein
MRLSTDGEQDRPQDPAGMADFTETAVTQGTGTEPLFAKVVCGIDGSRASLEAARQAAVLAAGGELRLVSVTWTTGTGPTEMTALGEPRARAALEAAAAAGREIGAHVATEVLRDPEPARALLEQASGADLTAVGTHGGSRRAGIFLGSVASRVAHGAAGPVLVARRLPPDSELPSHVMVATDGSPGSSEATRLAGRIAARFHSPVTLLHAGGSSTATERHAIAVQVAELLDATGAKPTVVELDGKAPDVIASTAGTGQVSLIVIGSRGLGGLKALGSVSERVVHTAPCPVLVARPSY